MDPSQNFASASSKTSFISSYKDKPSIIISPRKQYQVNKSIKFALDTNPEPPLGLRNSRNSSFFQPITPDFYNESGAISPNRRKRTTSMSINKLMIRLKMGINSFNSGMPNSSHRTLIDQINQLNEIKKDKDNPINSLDNYTKEELITVFFFWFFWELFYKGQNGAKDLLTLILSYIKDVHLSESAYFFLLKIAILFMNAPYFLMNFNNFFFKVGNLHFTKTLLSTHRL